MGVSLKARAMIAEDEAIALQVEVEHSKRKDEKAKVPVFEIAHLSHNGILPAGKTLLLRMPIRHAKPLFYDDQPAHADKTENEKIILTPVDLSAEVKQYIYVLINSKRAA